jgi:cytochrome P450 family 9
MKDTFTRYTNDVIATSAFGIKVDSLTDENNEFYTMGKKLTVISGAQMTKMMLKLIFPFVFKVFRLNYILTTKYNPIFLQVFKIKMFDPKLSKFFKDLISNQMRYREENNIVRPDMIHLLMEAKKGSLKYDKSNETDTKEFATVEESTMGQKTTDKGFRSFIFFHSI